MHTLLFYVAVDRFPHWHASRNFSAYFALGNASQPFASFLETWYCNGCPAIWTNNTGYNTVLCLNHICKVYMVSLTCSLPAEAAAASPHWFCSLGGRACNPASQPEYATSGALSSVWPLQPEASQNTNETPLELITLWACHWYHRRMWIKMHTRILCISSTLVGVVVMVAVGGGSGSQLYTAVYHLPVPKCYSDSLLHHLEPFLHQSRPPKCLLSTASSAILFYNFLVGSTYTIFFFVICLSPFTSHVHTISILSFPHFLLFLYQPLLELRISHFVFCPFSISLYFF